MKSLLPSLLLLGTLVVGGCAPQPDISAIEGSAWVVESINGQPTIDGASPTMQFMEEGRIAGTTGCNQYFGGWRMEGEEVVIDALGMTKMACEPRIMDQEGRFAGIANGRFVIDVEGEDVLVLRGEVDEMRLLREIIAN